MHNALRTRAGNTKSNRKWLFCCSFLSSFYVFISIISIGYYYVWYVQRQGCCCSNSVQWTTLLVFDPLQSIESMHTKRDTPYFGAQVLKLYGSCDNNIVWITPVFDSFFFLLDWSINFADCMGDSFEIYFCLLFGVNYATPWSINKWIIVFLLINCNKSTPKIYT